MPCPEGEECISYQNIAPFIITTADQRATVTPDPGQYNFNWTGTSYRTNLWALHIPKHPVQKYQND